MRHLISDDELWEEFAQRALIRVAAEGADFGEVLTTVEAVGSGGSHEWHKEWTATAERLASVAGSCAARGRRVSAR